MENVALFLALAISLFCLLLLGYLTFLQARHTKRTVSEGKRERIHELGGAPWFRVFGNLAHRESFGSLKT